MLTLLFLLMPIQTNMLERYHYIYEGIHIVTVLTPSEICHTFNGASRVCADR